MHAFTPHFCVQSNLNSIPGLSRQVCIKRRGSGLENRTPYTASLSSDIERALCHKFKQSKVSRVIESVRAISTGAVLENGIGTPSYQLAHSFVKFKETAKPWHDVNDYPWVKRLESEWKVIADELSTISTNPSLLSKGNNVWAPPVVAAAVSYGKEWKTLVLQDHEWDETNCSLFPRTAKIIRESGVPSVEAFFARQAPNSGIKLHTDGTNFIHTAHLALDVPPGLSWIEVGGEKRYWESGKVLIFDTSFFHQTMNSSPDTSRYVLLLRFWAPGLTRIEKEALRFVFDAIENPELVASVLKQTFDGNVKVTQKRRLQIGSQKKRQKHITKYRGKGFGK